MCFLLCRGGGRNGSFVFVVLRCRLLILLLEAASVFGMTKPFAMRTLRLRGMVTVFSFVVVSTAM
jgi:hypothetical protein